MSDSPRVAEFKKRVAELCDEFDICIAHEDEHGAFRLLTKSTNHCVYRGWFDAAHDETDPELTLSPPESGGETPRSRRTPQERWEEIQRAAAAYGKRWGHLRPLSARGRLLVARVREFGGDSDVLVRAVHGYMAFHRDGATPSFNAMKYFVPETVFRPGNFAKYVEACDELVSQGLEPPFLPKSDPGPVDPNDAWVRGL